MPLKFIQNAARGWWGGTNSLTGGMYVLLGGGSASGTANPVRTTAGFLSATAVPGVTSTITGTPSSFFRRQANTLNYHSPSWNGFSFQGAFTDSKEQTGLPETNALSPRLMSLAGQYRSGPLYLGLGYERHTDYNPANQAYGTTAVTYAGGTDDNWTVTAGYTFAGVFNLRGTYSKTDFDTTNSTSMDVDGWAILADWNIQGPHTLRAQYVSVDDTGGTSAVNVGSYKGPAGAGCGVTSAVSCASSTGAKQWGLAYSYAFSKRTMGSIIYTKMDNDTNAVFSRGKVAASAGNTQSSFGVAMQHRF
jgi:predicted porin